MGRLTNCIIIFALSVSSAILCGSANAQTNLQSKAPRKPTGSISGRVTVKGKGKGGIVVGARTGELGQQVGTLRKAISDGDGNYRVTDLPAGTYQVTPVAPSFIISDINPLARQGKSVILAEAENVDDIDFSMLRGGVITGRVGQADGRPVIDERINITLAEQTNPATGPTQFGSQIQTDDRGIYRVFGLPAGRYKVSIGQGPDTFPGGNIPGRRAYERVYYPDVTDANEAKVVELGEGSEATSIDITVGESIKGFAAAGMVIDGETKQPIPNLRFGVQKVIGERGSSFFGSTVLSDRMGAFRFENLMPGRYQVISMPQQNSDLRVDTVGFEILDQDISGITLRAVKGASVSGTIVISGSNDKTILSRLAKLTVQAYVRSGDTGSGFIQTSAIGADGSFRIGGLQPGTAQFQLGAQDRTLLKGFVISRVERDGVAFPRGLEIKPEEQIFGLRLIVVYGSGIVRGTVKIENGPLPTGARMMLRLINPEEPSAMVIRPQETDARGRFAIEGVPAGIYELSVSVFIPGSRLRQPSTKQSITVVEGSTIEVEPVVDLEPSQPARP